MSINRCGIFTDCFRNVAIGWKSTKVQHADVSHRGLGHRLVSRWACGSMPLHDRRADETRMQFRTQSRLPVQIVNASSRSRRLAGRFQIAATVDGHMCVKNDPLLPYANAVCVTARRRTPDTPDIALRACDPTRSARVAARVEVLETSAAGLLPCPDHCLALCWSGRA